MVATSEILQPAGGKVQKVGQAMVVASTLDMPRLEWLNLRRLGIGGSDAAAIAGISKYKSKVSVWAEKTGMLPIEDGTEQSEASYWGTRLEDTVADEFMKQTGMKVTRKNALLRHPDYAWMQANVDRLIIGTGKERGILECKTTGAHMARFWEAGPPHEHILQVMHYLAVTGFEYGYIAVLIGGQHYAHWLIERDQEVIDYLIDIEGCFWYQHVVTKEAPELDGSRSSSDLIASMYPDSIAGQTVELPPVADDLLAEYDRAKRQSKQADAEVDAAANKLKALMGEAEVAFAPCGRKVSWKKIEQNRCDTTALKDQFPEIAAQFVKQSSYRRFEVR